MSHEERNAQRHAAMWAIRVSFAGWVRRGLILPEAAELTSSRF